MEFIDKLIEIMKEKDITQYKLCKDLNIGQSTFTAWKNGKCPKVDTFKSIVQYLEVPADELLDIESRSFFTNKEIEIVKAYREAPDYIQKSVEMALQVSNKTDTFMETSYESKIG